MTAAKQGNLADKTLGELICEIQNSSGSGALRLSRDRAKTVIYFEDGAAVFAASNIRAHRLVEFLKRNGLADETSLATLAANATDDVVLAHVINQGKIKSEQAETVRGNHVTDILRGTLLWTAGQWQFDERVRVSGDNRVSVDTRRLLLEATRHLPAKYVESRFANRNDSLAPAQHNGHSLNLSPSEAFVLSRVSTPISIKDLLALGGMPEQETLRAVYALTTAGLLRRAGASTPHVSDPPQSVRAASAEESVEEFLARIDRATDHYETLKIDRAASADDVKNSYHALARSFHPDRFHQASDSMRARIDSAFARIARAYEVLHHESARASYDDRLTSAAPAAAQHSSTASTPKAAAKETESEDRAEASFQKGLQASKANQLQHALRLFAEAASLEPRRARYRAEYGRALTNNQQTRRIAEIELKAAIALEPDNISYRVALAELYKALGLRRRAEGELQRALVTDPKNDAAKKLLASLKN